MIYWKKGIYFGQTSIEGLKKLREINIDVKTISSVHYYILCFIKYLFAIMLLPIILALLIINFTCKYISAIISIPIDKYNKYF